MQCFSEHTHTQKQNTDTLTQSKFQSSEGGKEHVEMVLLLLLGSDDS